MSFISKLKTIGLRALASIAFYSAVGVIFLVLLPFAYFPPQIGLTGILNLITAYGLFKKRFWAKWLVAALFFVATVISLYTLAYIIFSDWIMSISMIAYAVLTCVFTAFIILKRKP